MSNTNVPKPPWKMGRFGPTVCRTTNNGACISRPSRKIPYGAVGNATGRQDSAATAWCRDSRSRRLTSQLPLSSHHRSHPLPSLSTRASGGADGIFTPHWYNLVDYINDEMTLGLAFVKAVASSVFYSPFANGLFLAGARVLRYGFKVQQLHVLQLGKPGPLFVRVSRS